MKAKLSAGSGGVNVDDLVLEIDDYDDPDIKYPKSMIYSDGETISVDLGYNATLTCDKEYLCELVRSFLTIDDLSVIIHLCDLQKEKDATTKARS